MYYILLILYCPTTRMVDHALQLRGDVIKKCVSFGWNVTLGKGGVYKHFADLLKIETSLPEIETDLLEIERFLLEIEIVSDNESRFQAGRY